MDEYRELYRRSILPELAGVLAAPHKPMIKAIHHYNLSEDRELNDKVGPYQSSLLWLVSNAFEERAKTPLLGLEAFSGKLALPSNHHRYVANGYNPQSDSRSHGGFDNDPATMRHLLKTILDEDPSEETGFQDTELSGY